MIRKDVLRGVFNLRGVSFETMRSLLQIQSHIHKLKDIKLELYLKGNEYTDIKGKTRQDKTFWQGYHVICEGLCLVIVLIEKGFNDIKLMIITGLLDGLKVLNIAHNDSHQEPCLQTVDFVCGAIYRCYNQNDSKYFEIIKNKCSVKHEMWKW